jgi:hypothetical protein
VGLLTEAQRLYAAAPLGNHVRASYFDETREQVHGLLKTLHYRKIAVIYPDDAFGEAVLQGVETALKANGAAGGNGFICAAVKRFVFRNRESERRQPGAWLQLGRRTPPHPSCGPRTPKDGRRYL